jgi:hypothetical protein
MRLTRISAALAAAPLLAGASGSIDARVAEPWAWSAPRACTPEVHRCLEKLEARVYFQGRSLDEMSMDQVLLELQETDAECALLLQATGLYGL